MKNRLLSLLFICLFSLGNLAFGLDLKDGGMAEILIGKNGVSTYSFTIPDKYLDKEGELILPLAIELSSNGKQPVFSTYSYEKYINLPADLSGTYQLEVKVGKEYFTEIINL